MTSSQYEVALSEIAQLIEQQRYEEALSALADILEEDPSQREARTYRLLVVRILVLRHYLAARKLDPTTCKRALARAAETLTSAARAVELRAASRTLASVGRRTRTWLARDSMIRITIAVAVSAALITCLTLYAGEPPSERQDQLRNPNVSAGSSQPIDVIELRPARIAAPDLLDPAAVLSHTGMKSFGAEALEALSITSRGGESASDENREAFAPEPVVDGSVAVAQAVVAARRADTAGSRKSALAARAQKLWPQYETLHSVSLRRSARFAAPIVREIEGGILVNVLELHGSWARVRIADESISGFVRREFLMPVAAAAR